MQTVKVTDGVNQTCCFCLSAVNILSLVHLLTLFMELNSVHCRLHVNFTRFLYFPVGRGSSLSVCKEQLTCPRLQFSSHKPSNNVQLSKLVLCVLCMLQSGFESRTFLCCDATVVTTAPACMARSGTATFFQTERWNSKCCENPLTSGRCPECEHEQVQ